MEEINKNKSELQNMSFDRSWDLPAPNNKIITVTQKDFINQYYPSGHKIFDKDYFPDKTIEVELPKERGKPVQTQIKIIEVKRVALAIQSMTIDVIVPHLLGNDIVHKQIVFNGDDKNEEYITGYKNVWSYKNMHYKLYEFVEHCLICGEAAIYIYFDKNKKLKSKTLSYLNGDLLCPKYDTYGNLEILYRKYKTTDENGDEVSRIDEITDSSVTTYKENGDYVETFAHPFPYIPVKFHRRRDGAYWTKVQNNIDSLEWNMSALSEDNKTKTKGKYHIKVSNPSQVQSRSIGGSDVIVTDVQGDFKFLQPADLSEAFKYEYETLKENIFDALGIVFLKMKASGDMPTGSMKLLFYPSERVCKQLTKEFSESIQEISDIFKKGVAMEYPTLKINDDKFIIQSNIQVFVPSDDIATLSASADAFSKGALTFESMVRGNPKYLDTTDILLKQKENEEKARLQTAIKTDGQETKEEEVVDKKEDETNKVIKPKTTK